MPTKPKKRVPVLQLAKRITSEGGTAWASRVSVKTLENAVVACKQAYYNSANPLLSDDIFDELVDVLKERAPRSPALGVGAKVRNKVELPLHMGSLDKVKASNELARWIARQEAQKFLVMDKLDGVSFLLSRLDAGEPVLYTRGDGRHGQDISAWLPYLDIPTPPKGAAVRGELIMSDARFNQVWAKHAANARNLVSGLVNRKSLSKGLRDVDAIAYEYVPGRAQTVSPQAQLVKLRKLGYRIPSFTVTNEPDFSKLADRLTKRKAKSPYAIDGLVLVVNEPNKRPTKGNPPYARALKVNLASEAHTVEVVDVVWRASRHGKIKPRVKIKPTRISGVTVTYISGQNARYIRKSGLGPGAVVKVVRSGDVIPYITEIVKPAKPKMPDGAWEWDGVEAVLPSDTHSDEAQLRATEFFFTTMGIEGIKYGTITKLAQADYPTLQDIVRMPESEMVDVLGQAAGKRLSKALDNMYDARGRLDLLMAASGVFPGIGKTRMAQLVAAVPDVMTLRGGALADALSDLPNWGESLANNFQSNLMKFKRFVKDLDLGWYVPDQDSAGTMVGEVVLYTGFRDAELTKEIEKAGGRVAGNWSSKVTVLVTKDGKSTSAKAKAAKRSGVPIVSPDQLRRQYLEQR